MWTGHESQVCFTLRVWSPTSECVRPAVLYLRLSPLLSLHISIALTSPYTVPGSAHPLTRGTGGRKERGGKTLNRGDLREEKVVHSILMCQGHFWMLFQIELCTDISRLRYPAALRRERCCFNKYLCEFLKKKPSQKEVCTLALIMPPPPPAKIWEGW